MGYGLGVDLGTTFTAAAVCRAGQAEIVELGDRGAVIPSVVWADPDGSVLVGEGALRRGAREPTRFAREFKRRFGDPVPLLLGGSPYSAETLAARVLRRVYDIVCEREGGRPNQVVVTHPASWSDYKLDALRQAVVSAELGPIELLGEPHAAALSYAATERVPIGTTVLVYDLGGGTFDVAILRKTDTGFELVGPPEGLERLGGIDFDESIFDHLRTSVDGSLENLDPDDTVATTMLARLRHECVAAKEALSTDTETTIPVLLPDVQTEVRLIRAEFEAMIRPPLDETLAATRRALHASTVKAEDIDTVLLVGGSSRVPIVSRCISADLGLPVAVDAHPKHGVALGAALVAYKLTQPASGDPPSAPTSPAASQEGPVKAHNSGPSARSSDPPSASRGATPRGPRSATTPTAGKSSPPAQPASMSPPSLRAPSRPRRQGLSLDLISAAMTPPTPTATPSAKTARQQATSWAIPGAAVLALLVVVAIGLTVVGTGELGAPSANDSELLTAYPAAESCREQAATPSILESVICYGTYHRTEYRRLPRGAASPTLPGMRVTSQESNSCGTRTRGLVAGEGLVYPVLINEYAGQYMDITSGNTGDTEYSLESPTVDTAVACR